MYTDEKLEKILEKFFDIEDRKYKEILKQIRREFIPDSIQKSKEKILKKLELHSQASNLIEEEVSKYREDLYLFAKKVAESEMEEDIITKSHVIKAKQVLWRKKWRYNISDGFITIGALALGSCVPHLIEIATNNKNPSILLILIGIFGALFLGMGIIGKSKE